MFEKLFPDEYYESAYIIPYEKLWDKGYRAIIYDIDNTLVPHGAPADQRSIELFERLKKIGFECMLLSNNRKERVDLFNKDVHVHTMWKAGKPNPEAYIRSMEEMGTDRNSTIFIGDQIFTDVWGAKRAGIKALMVKYMDPHEEIQIILKRRLEWFILKDYLRKHKMIKKGDIEND
jgi:HAD superfamily phosphatase (TIGR01668 family)